MNMYCVCKIRDYIPSLGEAICIIDLAQQKVSFDLGAAFIRPMGIFHDSIYVMYQYEMPKDTGGV